MDGVGDRFCVSNAPLRMLILLAYELLDDQLVGGPGWINTDRFDIVAVRGGAPSSRSRRCCGPCRRPLQAASSHGSA